MPKRRPTPEQLQAIGLYVRRARLAANLTLEAAADRASMSHVTWGNVEDGEPARAMSYAKIERALGWQSGCIDEYLVNGAVPSMVPADGAAHGQASLREDIAAEIERIRHLSLPATTRLRMIQTLIDLFDEVAADERSDVA
jgi:transcriptional regulator with XRE-family HTH domain